MKKVDAILKKYINKLGLHDYHIDVMIVDDKHYLANKKNLTHEGVDYLAEVINRNYYAKSYQIAINKNALESDIDDTILHELLHIMLYGLSDLVEGTVNILGLPKEREHDLLVQLEEREHGIIERLIKILK